MGRRAAGTCRAVSGPPSERSSIRAERSTGTAIARAAPNMSPIRATNVLLLVASLGAVSCVAPPGVKTQPGTQPDIWAGESGASERAMPLPAPADGALSATPDAPPTATIPIAPADHASDARFVRRQSTAQRADNPWEVIVAGVGANDDEFNAGGLNLAASVGYYFTEWFEVSLRQGVSMIDAGRGLSDRWDASSLGAIDFHIPLGTVVPYVGANFGYVYGDTTDETLAAGPEAGIRIYVKPETFLLISAEYEFFFDSQDRIDDAFEDGTFLYGLGFGVRF